MESTLISTPQAFLMGIVEGITEYLPISSTGHLIITSDLIGLGKAESLTPSQLEAIQAYEIVIQGGAILAVLFLYRKYFWDVALGVMGKSSSGRRLFGNIVCATMPVLVAGFLLKGFISQHLQFTGPVLAALVVGGLVMVLFERFWLKNREVGEPLELGAITWKQALAVGGMQCLALWPGTSRSMVTIIGGMTVGLKRPQAAEFSFLIGLPALLAATAYKALKSGPVLVEHVGVSSLAVGFLTSTVFAFFAVKWLINFLNRNGLAPFGVYRLLLAAAVYFVVGI